jgi:hypothetical protein
LLSMAKALNEKLSSEDVELKKSVQKFMNDLISDRYDAQKIWASFVSKNIVVKPTAEKVIEEPALQPVIEKVVEEPVLQPVIEKVAEEALSQPVVEKEVETFPEEQIMKVIADHPEGIKLVDIGNKLGTDWRSLISFIKPLVDGGKIDKIDSLYYAKS